MSAAPAPGTATADVQTALTAALETVHRNIARFGQAYPDDTTRAGRYPLWPSAGAIAEGGNRGWTTSFWPGMQWLAWELSGDETFRAAAERHAADFARRVR